MKTENKMEVNFSNEQITCDEKRYEWNVHRYQINHKKPDDYGFMILSGGIQICNAVPGDTSDRVERICASNMQLMSASREMFFALNKAIFDLETLQMMFSGETSAKDDVQKTINQCKAAMMKATENKYNYKYPKQ